jgi:hypothetical protein
VGIISLLLTLTLPIEMIEWAGWIYFSMAILVPLYKAFLRRKTKRRIQL